MTLRRLIFRSYLICIAVFGLFQAIFMANAGGCWDNAKKIVEVDLKEKGTPLHEATVVGDTVGDPFKDTSSVAMNPIIKFTTLFGLLAMEIAISQYFRAAAPFVGVGFPRHRALFRMAFVLRNEGPCQQIGKRNSPEERRNRFPYREAVFFHKQD